MTRPFDPTSSALARFAVALALVAVPAEMATSQKLAPDSGAPPPPRVQSAGGIEFINGGAGEEARAAIAAVQSNFGLNLVFSDRSGAYVVVDRVRVRQGPGEVFDVDSAGPMLLIKLLPGDYTVEATYGGKVERRVVQLGRERIVLNWRWPNETAASSPR